MYYTVLRGWARAQSNWSSLGLCSSHDFQRQSTTETSLYELVLAYTGQYTTSLIIMLVTVYGWNSHLRDRFGCRYISLANILYEYAVQSVLRRAKNRLRICRNFSECGQRRGKNVISFFRHRVIRHLQRADIRVYGNSYLFRQRRVYLRRAASNESYLFLINWRYAVFVGEISRNTININSDPLKLLYCIHVWWPIFTHW